jgi:hypothetical protein
VKFQPFSVTAEVSTEITESGSRLTKINSKAFCNCCRLKSISLPASVADIDCDAFVQSSIQTIIVDEANPHYFISGASLMGVEGMTLIWYFGLTDTTVVIHECESLGKLCFANSSLRTIGFEDGSRLVRIASLSFLNCSEFKLICIPAGVEILGQACFSGCSSLSHITFGSGSKLARIERSAFEKCSSLTSIRISAHVENISHCCFDHCKSLEELSFEADAKLTEIASMALSQCSSLHQFDSYSSSTSGYWKRSLSELHITPPD